MINLIKNYLSANRYALPNGTNLFSIEKMICCLNKTTPHIDSCITFEQFKEKYIYNHREVPSSGWNDPNESWYYAWQEYIDSKE